MTKKDPQPKLYRHGTTTVLLIALATLLGLSGLATAGHGGSHGGDAEIDVDWHLDNKGANVTSTKEISNIIVEFCPDPETGERSGKKYDNLDTKEFEVQENETIIAIWVKSGANHDPNDPRPPAEFDRGQSVGEYFENEDAICPGDPDPHPEEPPCRPHVSATAEEGPMNHVTWTEMEEAESFNVWRAVEDGDFEKIAEVGPDTHEFEDTNVTVGTTYSYQVTANLEEGQDTEPCNTATVTAIPVFPTLLAVGAASVLGLGAYVATKRRS